MRYYLVNVNHHEIYRPATTNSRVAQTYAHAMNLVTPGNPYAVARQNALESFFEDGWSMCDWVGLFGNVGDGLAEYFQEELPF